MYPFFFRLSRIIAYLGGLMLALLIVLTCISILGRSLNGFLHSDIAMSLAPGIARWLINAGVGPINGDYELVEAGIAFSIFAFLPLCQISGGHASVDVFAANFPPGVNRLLQAVIDVLFALVLVLIVVQLYLGMDSKLRAQQTSLLLEFPVWWGYAICLIGAGVAALVGIYIAVMRLAELVRGRDLLPHGSGAEH